MKAILDTNVLVRHLTADPPDQAAGATAFIAGAEELVLTDIVIAELVYALETVYRVERARVAELLRAVIAFPAIVVLDEALLLRALELYEQEKLDFVTSYLAAGAELSGVGVVASFYHSLERIKSVQLLEPR